MTRSSCTNAGLLTGRVRWLSVACLILALHLNICSVFSRSFSYINNDVLEPSYILEEVPRISSLDDRFTYYHAFLGNDVYIYIGTAWFGQLQVHMSLNQNERPRFTLDVRKELLTGEWIITSSESTRRRAVEIASIQRLSPRTAVMTIIQKMILSQDDIQIHYDNVRVIQTLDENAWTISKEDISNENDSVLMGEIKNCTDGRPLKRFCISRNATIAGEFGNWVWAFLWLAIQDI